MSEAKKTVKKFSLFAMGPIINIFIGLVSVPITTRLLLPQEFGKSTMYSMAYGILSIFLQLGLVYSLAREYPEQRDKKKLTFHCVLPSLAVYSIVSILVLYFWEPLSLYLFNSLNHFMILLLMVNVLMEIFIAFTGGIMRMQEKALLSSLVSILNRNVSFVITVTFLLFVKKDFTAIIWGQTISHFVLMIINLILTRDHWGFTRLDKRLLKQLGLLGLPMLPAGLIAWLAASVDKFALRYWTDLSEIGIYGAANKFVTLVLIFSTAFSQLWMPFSLRWRKENRDVSIFKRTNVIIGLGMSYVIIAMIMVKGILINYFGSAYNDAQYVMPFLLLMPAFTVFSSIVETVLHEKKKSFYILITSNISLGFNVLGNFLLVPRWGALGAAISTSISMVFIWGINAMLSRRMWRNIITWPFLTIVAGLISVPIISLKPGFLYIPWSAGVLILITLINRKEFLYMTDILFTMARDFINNRIIKKGNK